jgi:tetratricopeptide (TPR) repeat protein
MLLSSRRFVSPFGRKRKAVSFFIFWAKEMKFIINFLAALVALLFVSGCVSNPINAYTANRYYDAGVQAEKAGDLTLARMNYSRAYANAQMGFLGPSTEAHALYEWSRVTGYLGMYAESEKGFINVLALIEKANGEADKLRAPALSELARLLHDTGQHAKAVAIYEKAVPELEKVDILKIDPLGFAVFLDDYSASLTAVGLTQRAAEVASRSAVLKDEYKGMTPKFEPRRYNAPKMETENPDKATQT